VAEAVGDPGQLEAIMQTALEVGVRVQMSGGYTARVRETVRHVALSLGAERAECSLSSGSLGLTVHRGGSSHTAIRTVPSIGVNFTELSYLSRLAKRSDGMTIAEVRDELAAIAARERRYPVPMVLILLGVSCGSFAGLFGADPVGVALAGLGGLVGALVRHIMLKQRFKPFVYCLIAAFVSVSVALLLARVLAVEQDAGVNIAVTASILFLVPGVPLLNGTADLLTSNYLNGIIRLTRASVIMLGATFGLSIASFLWGHS
jgi:uncharacterized membrane protein YjjP (DUF1212 family)